MTESELNSWLEKYGSAWENQDADAVSTIFTEAGTYAWGPFTDPIRGRKAIHAAWEHATKGQQEDIKFGTGSDLAGNPNDATVFLNDAVRHRESQSRAFSNLPGRKEQIEYPFHCILIHTWASIGNRHHRVITGR